MLLAFTMCYVHNPCSSSCWLKLLHWSLLQYLMWKPLSDPYKIMVMIFAWIIGRCSESPVETFISLHAEPAFWPIHHNANNQSSALFFSLLSSPFLGTCPGPALSPFLQVLCYGCRFNVGPRIPSHVHKCKNVIIFYWVTSIICNLSQKNVISKGIIKYEALTE